LPEYKSREKNDIQEILQDHFSVARLDAYLLDEISFTVRHIYKKSDVSCS
jgi:hypothetical protein